MNKLILLPPLSLKPYVNNARLHSEGQIKKIIASMKRFQWTRPILIDEDHMILAGHGRQMAAIRLDLPEVPCIIIPNLRHEEKMSYILSDNALAEEATWDEEVLTSELLNLKELQFDINLTGFNFEFELEETMREERLSSGQGVKETTPEIQHKHHCPHCDFKFS